MTLHDPGPKDVTAAVRGLVPRLRRLALEGSVMIGFGAVIVGLGVFMLFSKGLEDKSEVNFSTFMMLMGVLAVIGAYRWARKQQEALVMPVLAEAVGLTFAKDAKAFAKGLPKTLLPARGIRKGEDLVTGQLGAHSIRMAEIRVETGGKNSTTLFMGLVAQFANQVVLPSFFMAPEDKTGPVTFFSNDLGTEGLVYLQSAKGSTGRAYGVWASSLTVRDDPALTAVVDVLLAAEGQIGNGAALYSVLSDGQETHIALNHRVNLFSLGGIFPKESRLFSDVQDAMADMGVPLRLAATLIEAEAAAAAAKKGVS